MYKFLLAGLLLVGCQEQPRYQPRDTPVYKPKVVPSYLKQPEIQGTDCSYENAVVVSLNENGTGSFITCKDYTITRNGPVTSGRPQNHRTPRGNFKIGWQAKEWDSKTYPSTDGTRNMDYASFFNNGIALHAGSVRALSHGCVHMRRNDARYVYENFGNGDAVIVE